MNKVATIEPATRAVAIATPAEMLVQAVTSGAGVEVVEKLLNLHERWEAMQARKAFDNAMAELRQDMPTIIKQQSASFGAGKTAYQYEDLSAVTEALSPIMANVGLSFRWRTASTDKSVSVTCVISHKDGHSEETTLSSGLDTSGSKNAIQALGSAVTYLQRYTLKAAVGVAAAKDDDGNAVARQDEPPAKPAPKARSREPYTDLQAELDACETLSDLQILWSSPAFKAEFKRLPKDWQDQLTERKDELKDKLSAQAEASRPLAYVAPNFDGIQQ